MNPSPPSSPAPRSWIGPLFVSASVVGAAAILAGTVGYAVRVKYREPTIGVTGSSTRRIRSDRVLWSATVVARAPGLADAFRVLQVGTPRVKNFLTDHGIPAAE